MGQPPVPAPDPTNDAIPEALEEEVLQALELDDAGRDRALANLLLQQPAHARAIRNWLAKAGVPVPDAACGDASGGTAGGADPTLDPADESSEPPRRIGRYRVLELLGRGGFGSVYLAEPLDAGPRRRVAIKVLNPGMDSREVLRRFAAEREALSRVDHPGIARMLDAGSTATGRPFFVMEHVAGESLLLHCRRRDLSIDARIDLFLLVLDAVAHAHRRGLVHRDLSSNNVLVQTDGDRVQPKIIDFGVAKSIHEPLLEGGALTFQGTLMGTPEYLSPEQAQGQLQAIDTRTDVYSLGVQLYELLADQLPIPGVVLRAQGIAGMAEVIRTYQPSRPSHVAPPARQPLLRQDLDWIALKAIAKNRDDRYGSVVEFAEDLRRHQEHLPVVASPPSTWYLLRKFARRNRAQVAVAIAVLVLLVGATATSLWLWRDARTARQELQTMHDELALKTRAGFRLLALEERLRAAHATLPQLDPPWPDRIPALRRWLADFGAPLRAELEPLREQCATLSARKAAQPGGTFLDADDEHLLAALQRLRADLEAFAAPNGALAGVEHRLRWAQDVAAVALERHADAWREAIAAIKKDRGFQLTPQPGLVPLGADPDSRQQEFLDLASHPPGLRIPRRRDDGTLEVQPATGIVFALLPAGTVRLGAQRSDSGLPQNDPFAEDDELHGQSARLAEFFVARTELTRAQWATLRGEPVDGDPRLPIATIDHETAQQTLRRFGMTLPTEAQWEYACRAGTSTPWWNGDTPQAARAAGNFSGAVQAVARLLANPFGLFDVHGNVAEWCADWKFDDYRTATVRNGDGLRILPPPMRPPELRVVRGGSAVDPPQDGRSSARAGRAPQAADPFLGLRPVRAVVRG